MQLLGTYSRAPMRQIVSIHPRVCTQEVDKLGRTQHLLIRRFKKSMRWLRAFLRRTLRLRFKLARLARVASTW
jgi:hypothetical protein